MKNTDTISKGSLYFFAKSSGRVYNVIENEDGSLFITLDGENSIPDAGLFIRNIGGIDTLKARCVRDVRSFEEIKREIIEKRKASRKAAKERAARRELEAEAMTERALEALIANYDNGIIEANVDNMRIVARYFSAHNRGLWQMPKMTIGYAANKYEGGAVTMIFDQPIDAYGEMESRFVFNARPNELTSYKHMRF